MNHIRRISTNMGNYAKNIPTKLKGKSKSSQDWLMRQFTDPYVEKAKMMNFRCRSVFKLMEIDDKHNLLSPGNIVVDCGAAPGSWSQLAAKRTNADGAMDEKLPRGAVFSIDLLHIHPIPGATILGGTDFTKASTQERLNELLIDKQVNCVLSDMAPNATGVRQLDQENITNLCYSVLRFAVLMSSQGANLLVKIWDNGNVQELEKNMLKFYESVRRIKPKSSRSESSEHFLLAKGFKGSKNTK